MSDIQRDKSTGSPVESESPLFRDAYRGCAATVARLEARSRQTTVAAYGAIVGGIKDIPNEFVNHPWETVGKVAVAGVTGVALGAATTAESPLIANAALVAGTITCGASLWNSCTRLRNNAELKQSMNAVYKSGDLRTMTNSMQVASDVIGPEAFNYGIATVGLRGGVQGPKAWLDLCNDYFANRLRPFIPMAEITPFRAVEMRFGDGSSLHMHGHQAVFRIGGDEWNLNVFDRRGVELGVRGSYLGHQVLKGSLGPGLFEVDINPRTGITRVKGDDLTEYSHSELAAKKQSAFPVSCEECRPFRQAMREARRHSND
jgi:hypothetical protein